jgi:DNA-binding MarR family transcriptional regulator
MEPQDALELVLSLGRVSSAVTRQIDRPLSGHHGLSLGDLALLLELQRAGGRLQRAELAEHLGITASGVARQLQPLERIGVVARESHPTDARLALVVLTAAGDTLATDAARTAGETASRTLDDRWSNARQAQLADLVARGR